MAHHFSVLVFFLLLTTTLARHHNRPSSSASSPLIQNACKATRYASVCESTFAQNSTLPTNPTAKDFIFSTIDSSQVSLKTAEEKSQSILDASTGNDLNRTNAAKNCLLLLSYSTKRLEAATRAVNEGGLADGRAWGSAALLYQYDCWSALKYVNGTNQVADAMSFILHITNVTSNALSMITSLQRYGDDTSLWGPPQTERDNYWGTDAGGAGNAGVGSQISVPTDLVPNVYVCDSGCNYQTVQAAVDAAPDWSDRYVIYIKEGVYKEIVRVPFEKTNLVFLGDGMGKTVITGNLNADTVGLSTYNTATVVSTMSIPRYESYDPNLGYEDYNTTEFIEMLSRYSEKKYEFRKTMSIYKVPSHIRMHDPDAYKPKLFTFGPVFHYDQSYDQSYKNNAVFFFIKRAKKGVRVLVKAVESVIEQVTMSYDLVPRSMMYGNDWLKMMFFDGCFMLEVMRAATEAIPEEYSETDPVFSNHGFVHMLPIIKRDMMILENQIPLVVLERLAAMESGEADEVDYINRLVMKFYNLTSSTEPTPCFLHVLDAYKKSVFRDPAKKSDVKFYPPSSAIICPLSDHYRAGYKDFARPSGADHNLNDISFECGSLCLPMLIIDNNTEVYFRNLIAFEKLHHGAGSDAASYISFMSSIIHSAQDVAILNHKGIIYNVSGSYEAVASMFRKLSKEVEISAHSHLNEVRIQLGKHFQYHKCFHRYTCIN